MTYCANCGFVLLDDAAFCPECGTPVKKADSVIVNESSGTAQSNSVSMAQIENSKFFQFAKPLMDSIDHGKFFKNPFRWLYIIFSVLCLIYPFAALILAIEKDIFKLGGFAAFLALIFISFSGWVGFQIWWNRKTKINRYVGKGDDFLATPTFSHFIQTIGEWYGITIAILGFGFSLCGLIAAGEFHGLNIFDSLPGLSIGGLGIFGLILFPFIGYFIVVFFRYIAETIRSFASIANNTKRSKGD